MLSKHSKHSCANERAFCTFWTCEDLFTNPTASTFFFNLVLSTQFSHDHHARNSLLVLEHLLRKIRVTSQHYLLVPSVLVSLWHTTCVHCSNVVLLLLPLKYDTSSTTDLQQYYCFQVKSTKRPYYHFKSIKSNEQIL